MIWVVTEGINPHDHTPGWLLITALVDSLQFTKSALLCFMQYVFLGPHSLKNAGDHFSSVAEVSYELAGIHTNTVVVSFSIFCLEAKILHNVTCRNIEVSILKCATLIN